MIDNFKLIESLLNFESEDIFYFCQVIQRKKDNNPDIKDNRIIKDIFIKSLEDYHKKKDLIIDFCVAFNARAYIRLNRCYHSEVALENLKIITECLQERKLHCVNSSYSTACGRRCYDKDKTWIVDIDGDVVEMKDEIRNFINNQKSSFDINVIGEIPTKNGIHFITKPFDPREMGKFEVDLHKNNPTILYCPREK